MDPRKSLFMRKKLTNSIDIVEKVLQVFDYTPGWDYDPDIKLKKKEREVLEQPSKGFPIKEKKLSALKAVWANEIRSIILNGEVEKILNKKTSKTPLELVQNLQAFFKEYEARSKNTRTHTKIVGETTAYFDAEGRQVMSGADARPETTPSSLRPSTFREGNFEKKLEKVQSTLEEAQNQIEKEIEKIPIYYAKAEGFLVQNNYSSAIEYFIRCSRLMDKHRPKLELNPSEKLKEILDDKKKFSSLTKHQLLDAIKALPIKDQNPYLEKCLNKNDELGKIFWKPRIPGTSTSLSQGTLKEIVDYQETLPEAKVKGAAAIKPETKEISLYWHGNIAMQKNHYKEAAEYYKGAYEIGNPQATLDSRTLKSLEKENLHLNRGDHFLKAEQYELAAKPFKLACEFSPAFKEYKHKKDGPPPLPPRSLKK